MSKTYKSFPKETFLKNLAGILEKLGITREVVDFTEQYMKEKKIHVEEYVYAIQLAPNKGILIFSSVDRRSNVTRASESDAVRTDLYWYKDGEFRQKKWKKNLRIETFFKNFEKTIKSAVDEMVGNWGVKLQEPTPMPQVAGELEPKVDKDELVLLQGVNHAFTELHGLDVTKESLDKLYDTIRVFKKCVTNGYLKWTSQKVGKQVQYLDQHKDLMVTLDEVFGKLEVNAGGLQKKIAQQQAAQKLHDEPTDGAWTPTVYEYGRVARGGGSQLDEDTTDAMLGMHMQGIKRNGMSDAECRYAMVDKLTPFDHLRYANNAHQLGLDYHYRR